MRPDFNKLLTERQRIGSSRSYKEHRNAKVFNGRDEDGQLLGGRESMKLRSNVKGDNKSFNENLRPLRSWVNSCVGKPWDKCYSEIRSTFDARKVINDHILQHLYQYIEVDTHVGADGKVWYIPHGRYYNKVAKPITDSYADYHVNPKDGRVVKTKHKLTRKQRNDAVKAKWVIECQKFVRKLEDGTELHLVNGTWFQYDRRQQPVLTYKYVRPYGIDLLAWEALSEERRKLVGVKTGTNSLFRDEAPTETEKYTGVHNWNYKRNGTYLTNRRTASAKLLKENGISGSTGELVGGLSRREVTALKKSSRD